jgi:hypothetical protein
LAGALVSVVDEAVIEASNAAVSLTTTSRFALVVAYRVTPLGVTVPVRPRTPLPAAGTTHVASTSCRRRRT